MIALPSGILVSVAIVARQIARGEQTLGSFVTFTAYLASLHSNSTPSNMRHQDKANQSILTVEQFGWMTNYINHLMTNTQKLIDLLDQTSDVVDRPAAVELLECQGVIEFENVTFSYEQLKKGSSKQSKPALDGVSFSVKRGEHVALVGESGSGKSTIFRLIFRFFDVQQGSIKVDGLDVRDYTQSSLRHAIGVVQQDVSQAPLHHAAILIRSA